MLHMQKTLLATTHIRHPLHKAPYSGWADSMWQDEVGPDTPLLTQLPGLEWVSDEVLSEDSIGSVHRLYLRLYSQLPCWGIINITGHSLVGWSFTKGLAPSQICTVGVMQGWQSTASWQCA